jgi:hypothetical protein
MRNTVSLSSLGYALLVVKRRDHYWGRVFKTTRDRLAMTPQSLIARADEVIE